MNTGHLTALDLKRALRVIERESGAPIRFGNTALRSALDVLPDRPVERWICEECDGEFSPITGYRNPEICPFCGAVDAVDRL